KSRGKEGEWGAARGTGERFQAKRRRLGKRPRAEKSAEALNRGAGMVGRQIEIFGGGKRREPGREGRFRTDIERLDALASPGDQIAERERGNRRKPGQPRRDLGGIDRRDLPGE